MNGARVSIYIPCYNAEEYIAQNIESLLGQTIKPQEIIVVDDGSKDKTCEIAARYAVRIIKHGKNRGLAAARSTGILAASADLVASLDADCVAEENWLAGLLSAMREDKKIVGVGGKAIEKYAENEADRWRAIHMRQHWGDRKLISPKVLYGVNTLFLKDALLNVGLYDEESVLKTGYKVGVEDYNICRKLRNQGYKLVYTPDAVVWHLRKDTKETVLRQYWRWSVLYYPRPNTIPRFLFKLALNFAKGSKHILTDILSGDRSLVPISIKLFPLFAREDLRYLWKCKHNDNFE